MDLGCRSIAGADTNKEYVCATCDKQFEDENEFGRHNWSHGSHECPDCLKRFRKKSDFEEHKRTHPVTFKAQTKSLADISEARILNELATLVSTGSDNSIFALGGIIAVNQFRDGAICDSDESTDKSTNVRTRSSKKKDDPSPSQKGMRCDPVTIRWDSTSGTTTKVSLPYNASENPNFEQLLRDCEPASFGRGGTSVMDKSYRKAGKLDTDSFCTNLNPYALGIIDTAAQALLLSSADRTNGSGGLRAELYKLNVYSAPSGKFKAHVDTPRSKHQVGSLVVCLPSLHKGGQLVVRHRGREQIFDWSGEKGNKSIQWAAFFSDCEHEVLEVTSGHRVTLTYNLYSTCQVNVATFDPQQIEVYTTLRNLLAQPAFCKRGAILGYHCNHAYPHTVEASFEQLPATLKGMDKIVFESLSQLDKVKVELRHNLEHDFSWDDERFEDEEDGESEDHDDNEFPLSLTKQKGDRAILSKDLIPFRLTHAGMYEDTGPDEMPTEWDTEHTIEHVVSLNRPNLDQPALAHGTYGNEPGINLLYASLVITVSIPPCDMR